MTDNSSLVGLSMQAVMNGTFGGEVIYGTLQNGALSAGKINDMHLSTVDRISEQQYQKGRRLHVLINSCLREVECTVCFNVNFQGFHSFPPILFLFLRKIKNKGQQGSTPCHPTVLTQEIVIIFICEIIRSRYMSAQRLPILHLRQVIQRARNSLVP